MDVTEDRTAPEHRQRTDDYGTASSMAPKSQTVTPPDPGARLGGNTELGEWQRAGTSLIFFQRGSIPHPWRWLHEVPWETAWVKITQDFALSRRPERAASSKPMADCPSQQHPPQLLVPNPHLYARLAHCPHELIAHAGEAGLHHVSMLAMMLTHWSLVALMGVGRRTGSGFWAIAAHSSTLLCEFGGGGENLWGAPSNPQHPRAVRVAAGVQQPGRPATWTPPSVSQIRLGSGESTYLCSWAFQMN